MSYVGKAAALALLLTAACSQVSAPPRANIAGQPDTAAIRKDSKARVDAINAGDFDTYLSAYEDEAVWMPPFGEDIVGKAAARQMLEDALRDSSVNMAGLSSELVVMSPDCVVDRGRYSTERSANRGIPGEEVGSYLTIWRRQEDGSFKIAYDIWNSDRPTQSELK